MFRLSCYTYISILPQKTFLLRNNFINIWYNRFTKRDSHRLIIDKDIQKSNSIIKKNDSKLF